jgi:DNA-binding XRE family transcriptional regulator
MTRAQFAEELGVVQQTVQAYEADARHIPALAPPTVARTLAVSLEVLFGEDQQVGLKRGPVPEWQQQMESIARPPRARQRFVTEVLDTVLAQQAH